MKESIFRRIDRAEYRREMARDPMPGNKFGCKFMSPILIPTIYGALLPLFRANNEEWYKVMVGWTNPWWDDWAKNNIPAIDKVSENLIVHGDIHQVLLAQHVYSVNPLLTLISVILVIIISQFRPKHLRFKRMVVYNSINRYGGFKNLNISILMFMATIPFFSYAIWDSMYNKGILYSGGYTFILIRSLYFHYTDWASCLILFIHSGVVSILSLVPIGIYHLVKIQYVNIRQQMRIREDRIRIG